MFWWGAISDAHPTEQRCVECFLRRSILIMTTIVLSGCVGGSGDSPEARLEVYKSAGSTQCAGDGIPLSVMARQLTDAGIHVFISDCGRDGSVYPAMCGAADGRIGIFEIRAAQLQAATTLGFSPLRDLPDAGKAACR